ncbi:MAG TPA: hypothetical protein VN493_26520 [Thermoanaerobaculia bacterium]|nr:hypothetical protein [Thermoanaerobaculia bacterium]
MNLPGMLVEYLITGSCALIWVRGTLLLLQANNNLPDGLVLQGWDGAKLAFLVPGIYVLGMLVDFLGKGLVDWFKKVAGKSLKKTESDKELRYWVIFMHAPELGRQIEIRSSRDRVARGAIVNAVIGTVVLALLNSANNSKFWWVILGGVFFSLLFSALWWRFYIRTSEFEIGASEQVMDKLRQDREMKMA